MFEASLKELGISPNSQALPISGAVPSALQLKSPVVAIASSTEISLRSLVELVIADMPLCDLRELRLPIGKVFDRIRELTR